MLLNKDQIKYYFMLANQYCINIYNWGLSNISNVKEIKIIHNNNNNNNGPIIKNVILQYFIFRIISTIIYFFEYIRSKVDISANKVHIYIRKENTNKYIILEHNNNNNNINNNNNNNDTNDINDTNDNDNKISFSVVHNQIQNNLVNDNIMNKNIFINFELFDESNNLTTCLKKYLVNYTDIHSKYQHTLHNILLFNNVPHNDNNIIHIRTFSAGKIKILKLPLTELKHKHINNII